MISSTSWLYTCVITFLDDYPSSYDRNYTRLNDGWTQVALSKLSNKLLYKLMKRNC